jgi:hypothetical protein
VLELRASPSGGRRSANYNKQSVAGFASASAHFPAETTAARRTARNHNEFLIDRQTNLLEHREEINP